MYLTDKDIFDDLLIQGKFGVLKLNTKHWADQEVSR